MATIRTRGEGAVWAMPDEARLSVSAVSELSVRERAIEQVNGAVRGLRDFMAEHDLQADESVWTSSWRDETGRDHARLHLQLSFNLTDADLVAGMVEVAVATQRCEVSGPHWSVGRANPANQAAREAAISDALERAHSYAKALGGQVTQVIEVADEGLSFRGRGEGMYLAAKFGGDADLDIDTSPRPMEVSGSVQLVCAADGLRV